MASLVSHSMLVVGALPISPRRRIASKELPCCCRVQLSNKQRLDFTTVEIFVTAYKFRCPRDARLRSNVFAAEK